MRCLIHAATLGLLLTACPHPTFAFPGELDRAFSTDDGGVDDLVKAVALLPDGRIVIGGKFKTVKGLERIRIARLEPNGEGDPTFDPGEGPSDDVSALAVLPDGKIIIAGEFIRVGQQERGFIARLNANGTLDPAFNPGRGANDEINTLMVQPDGKVLVGGWFSTFDGVNRRSIARLHADGSLDLSFDPGAGPHGQVSSIALQADGKVLIGGQFTEVDGNWLSGVARLLADGSVDPSFTLSRGTDAEVYSVAVQPDGNVVIGGIFNEVNKLSREGLARLHADGTLDMAFVPPSEVARVRAVRVQADGRVLAGGNGVTRFNADGAPDRTFLENIRTPGNASVDVRGIVVQPDGKLLMAGWFLNPQNSGTGIIRLRADGTPDPEFAAGTVLGSVRFGLEVSSVALAPDGKVLMAGAFLEVDGTRRLGLARLERNGRLDATFDPTPGTNSFWSPRSVLVQPDGKVLVGGDFSRASGAPRNTLARLEPDGSVDPSFTAAFGVDQRVLAMALQPEGRIVVGGFFTRIGTSVRNRIARLLPDGSVDASFDPGSGVGADTGVFALALQPDGKILLGGDFVSVRNTRRNGLARLNPDGTLDASFSSAIEVMPAVLALALQSDGKILAGGSFRKPDGTPLNGLVRLLPDGGKDNSFNSGVVHDVSAIAVQNDGQVLIGGYFDQVGRLTVSRLARLQPDGSLDTAFHPMLGSGDGVSALLLQPDGKLLLAGSLRKVNGVHRNYTARLLTVPGHEVTVSRTTHQNGIPEFTLSATSPRTVQVQASTNLVDWVVLSSVMITAEGIHYRDLDADRFPTRFYRVTWRP